LILALEVRRGDVTALALEDFGHDGDRRAHLDRGARDLAITLRVVDIADEEAAAIDEAGEQQRRAHLHLLHVHIAAVLARRNGAQAGLLVAAFGAADIGRKRTHGLRRQGDATHLAQLRLTGEPSLDLWLARQHADRTHEGGHGHAHARHLIRDRGLVVEFPVHDVRFGKKVAQEAETRNDHGIAVLVGRDVHKCDGQDVAALGALDIDGTGHGVHEVEIDGGHVVGRRVEPQIAVQRVARFENDVIACVGPHDRLYGRVIAVETPRVVLAMSARLCHDHRALPALIACVGKGCPH
jgi:hypothetical protein